MYQLAFEERPDYMLGFENFFMNHLDGAGQARKLANSVYAYATHIDRLDELAQAVDQIAHRHVAARILPEQYPLIGEKLLQTMKDVLGDAATDDIIAAWAEAYSAAAAKSRRRQQGEARSGSRQSLVGLAVAGIQSLRRSKMAFCRSFDCSS